MQNQVKFPTASSFFVALCMYFTIVLLLFIKLTFFTEPAKKYTDDKDAFMDIVMPERELAETPKAPEQKKDIVKENKPEPKNEPKEEKQKTTNKQVAPDEPLPTPSIPVSLKEPAKPEPKPEVPAPSETPQPKEQPKPEPVKEQLKQESIQDLFKSIDTTKLKKDSGIAKPQAQAQSRKKSEESDSKNSSQASDIIKSLKIDTTAKTPKSQMTGTYDPLRGAIQKQIERKWRSYKANSNNIAKIAVLIDGSGNFSYEILELSYDDEFNNKVRECLERLTQEKFPFSPDGAITININLEDKLE